MLGLTRCHGEGAEQIDWRIRGGDVGTEQRHGDATGNAIALARRLLDGDDRKARRGLSTRRTEATHGPRGGEPGLRVWVLSARRPYCREQDADDVDVVAGHEDVRAVEKAGVEEGYDD